MKTLTLAALAALCACPAIAAPTCAPRAVIADALSARYGEARRAMGLTRSGVAEVWANGDTGSWTITLTAPTARSGSRALSWPWDRRLIGAAQSVLNE